MGLAQALKLAGCFELASSVFMAGWNTMQNSNSWGQWWYCQCGNWTWQKKCNQCGIKTAWGQRIPPANGTDEMEGEPFDPWAAYVSPSSNAAFPSGAGGVTCVATLPPSVAVKQLEAALGALPDEPVHAETRANRSSA